MLQKLIVEGERPRIGGWFEYHQYHEKESGFRPKHTWSLY